MIGTGLAVEPQKKQLGRWGEIRHTVLLQNFPNPFNPETVIGFTVATAGWARLEVYNALGQRVATLHSGHVEAGRLYRQVFQAHGLGNGVYFAVLETQERRMTRSMLLLE